MKTEQKVKIAIAVPLIMLFGLPVPVIVGVVFGIISAIIIGIGFGVLKAISGIEIGESVFKPIIAVLTVGFFLFFYWEIIKRAVTAIKEGEGLFHALYLGIFEPVIEALNRWR